MAASHHRPHTNLHIFPVQPSFEACLPRAFFLPFSGFTDPARFLVLFLALFVWPYFSSRRCFCPEFEQSFNCALVAVRIRFSDLFFVLRFGTLLLFLSFATLILLLALSLLHRLFFYTILAGVLSKSFPLPFHVSYVRAIRFGCPGRVNCRYYVRLDPFVCAFFSI